MAKKKAIAFTCYDDKNADYARMMKASLRKFHSEEELPLIEVTGDNLKGLLEEDPQFFYRQKPRIAAELLNEYELVIGLDADQIFFGDIKHILEDNSYDIGTVLNFNPTDLKNLGPITTYIIDCTRYYNCGLVAMRSKKFVDHWKRLCYSPHIFNNLQYREQDVLNIMCAFGEYSVKCFDDKDPFLPDVSWHGLLAYGEGLKMKLVDDKVILPKDPSGYPNEDVHVRLFHFAHGNVANKMNYRTMFPESIIKHIDSLIR